MWRALVVDDHPARRTLAVRRGSVERRALRRWRPGTPATPGADRFDAQAILAEPDGVSAFQPGVDAVDDERAAAGAMRGDRAHHQIDAAAILGQRRAVADQRHGAAMGAIEATLRIAAEAAVHADPGRRPGRAGLRRGAPRPGLFRELRVARRRQEITAVGGANGDERGISG